MTLTEVVLEASDPSAPLCRLTSRDRGSRAVFRVIDAGHATGLLRATVTISGAENPVALLRELRDLPAHEDLEVLSLTPYALVIRLGERLEAKGERGATPAPVANLLRVFGPEVVLEPVFIEDGRARLRFLVARSLDTRGIILGLQETQKASGWPQFRVLRVADFSARRYADVLRRVLTPEQEDLLRVALALGFYSTPKGCTLEDIARTLKLSVSPVHKKLKIIEQLLVRSHVAPEDEPREIARRGKVPTVSPMGGAYDPGPTVETTLRIRWPLFELASFTAQTPRARVVYQPLGEDPKEKATSALAVIVADRAEVQGVLDRLARRADVLAIDELARDAEHATVRLRTSNPPERGWGAHANPLPRLLARLGREAFVKPAVLEGEDVWLKVVFMRSPGLVEVSERLASIADEAGWADHEITAMRPLDPDTGIGRLSPGEQMTARQEDVLKIAHALGYYKTPRDCTLEDIARTLGTSANAIHKNLSAAEQKLIVEYLSG